MGGGAGGGVLRVGDGLMDFVGAAPFWGGLLGGESSGDDGMRDCEQILVGETGATGSFTL